MSRIPEKVESILSIYPKIFNYIIGGVDKSISHVIGSLGIVYIEKCFPFETNSGIVVHSLAFSRRFRLRNDIGFPRLLSLLLPGLLSTGYGSLALSHRTMLDLLSSPLTEYVKVGGIRWIL